jgi:hypothetical protein
MAFPDSLFSPAPEGPFSLTVDWLSGEQASSKRRRTDAGLDYSLADFPLDGVEELVDSSEEVDSENDPFNGFVVLPLDEPTRPRPPPSPSPDSFTLSSTDLSFESVNTGNRLCFCSRSGIAILIHGLDGESRRRSFDTAFGALELSNITVVGHINLDAVLPTTRLVDTDAKIPFADNADNRIPDLTLSTVTPPKDGKLDGYIKIKFCKNHPIEEPVRNCHLGVPIRVQLPESSRSPTTPDAITDADALVRNTLGMGPPSQVLRMPKDLGLGCSLNDIDRNLFTFCGLEILSTLQ